MTLYVIKSNNDEYFKRAVGMLVHPVYYHRTLRMYECEYVDGSGSDFIETEYLEEFKPPTNRGDLDIKMAWENCTWRPRV